MKVLIIEDDEVTLKAVKDAFEESGFMVFTAKDGIEGIVELKGKNGEVDLIISDYNMPLFNGLQIATKIRNEDLTSAPFIIMTTQVSSDLKKEGKKLGVKAWIVKPIEPNIVVKMAMDIINKQG